MRAAEAAGIRLEPFDEYVPADYRAAALGDAAARMVKAIFARDYILLQGAVLVFALAFVVINLLVDLSYGLLDPRIGRQG